MLPSRFDPLWWCKCTYLPLGKFSVWAFPSTSFWIDFVRLSPHTTPFGSGVVSAVTCQSWRCWMWSSRPFDVECRESRNPSCTSPPAPSVHDLSWLEGTSKETGTTLVWRLLSITYIYLSTLWVVLPTCKNQFSNVNRPCHPPPPPQRTLKMIPCRAERPQCPHMGNTWEYPRSPQPHPPPPIPGRSPTRTPDRHRLQVVQDGVTEVNSVPDASHFCWLSIRLLLSLWAGFVGWFL